MRATLYGSRYEPDEPDPGGGWLRSKFMGLPYPRPGTMACGRPNCLVCGGRAQPFACEPVDAQHERQTLIRWR